LTSPTLQTARIQPFPGAKPRDDELDLFGLTHPGKVRRENQDHFLLCTVHPLAVVHATSLPNPDKLPLRGERLATVLLVADGVGGTTAGGEASQVAAEAVTRYVTSTLRCYHAVGADDQQFLEALRTAALEADAAVRAEAKSKSMATTLTLAIAVWPWLYVMQVGDSRGYYYWDGALQQITRDQTMAQDLVDRGALPPERMAASPFSNVLSSAIGGPEPTPEVSRLDISRRGCVILLCSDGLTKHVTNAEIAEQLGLMKSAEQVCHTLLDLALERGGSDNITILVGRAPPSKA
jgi:protein phosphatase